MKKRKSNDSAASRSSPPPQGDAKEATFWPDTLTGWFGTLKGDDENARAEVMAEMVGLYLPPVRRRLRSLAPDLSIEDAKDICQQFFLDEFLGKGVLASSIPGKYDPLKGRLRTYLSKALYNFLATWQRDRQRLKRGGGAAHVSLKAAASLPSADPRSNDPLFDILWAQRIMSLAYQALDEKHLGANGTEKNAGNVKKNAKKKGKAAGKAVQTEQTVDEVRIYEALKPYIVGAASDGSIKDIALSFGLTPNAVSKRLERLRKEWQTNVRAVIARTVTNPADIDDELRYLCEILGR